MLGETLNSFGVLGKKCTQTHYTDVSPCRSHTHRHVITWMSGLVVSGLFTMKQALV